MSKPPGWVFRVVEWIKTLVVFALSFWLPWLFIQDWDRTTLRRTLVVIVGCLLIVLWIKYEEHRNTDKE